MQLDVAAYGWLDAGWSGSYPDDLPLEWRLDYYANEYRSVVVPRGDWAGRDDEEILAWIGETYHAFEFFWELGNEHEARRLLAIYRACGDEAVPGGWLMLPDCDLDSTRVSELSAVAPVARCGDAIECRGDVTLLAVPEDVNLRQLRERLDGFRAAGAAMVLLVVKPSAAAATTLEQLQTLCQLYGG